jgi:hypothetical protein
MSDTSQGPGWWQASDGKWYAPESNPDYLASLPSPPSATVPASAAPTAGLQDKGQSFATPPARRLSVPQWCEVGALILSVIALLLPWASAGFLSVSGLNTQDGKIVGVMVLVTGSLLAWRVARSGRANGVLVLIAWLAVLGVTVAEIVHVTTSHPQDGGLSINVSVGTGLYLGGIAAVVGVVTAAMDLRRIVGTNTDSGITTGVASPALRDSSVRMTDETDSITPGPIAATPPVAGRSGSKLKWAVVVAGVLLLVGIQDVVLFSIFKPQASSEAKTASGAQTLPLRQSGSGSGGTPNFVVTKSSWRFRWSFDCPSGTDVGFAIFSVSIDDARGNSVTNGIVDVQNVLTASGETKPYYGPPGVYQLSVIASACPWELDVVQP